LLQQDPEAWFKRDVGDAVDADWVERLLAERAEARKRRDFVESDRIRDELAARGVVIEDGPQGARWKIATSGTDRDERAA
jgi:cysteinyl-tRNA synthetase